MLTAEYIVDKLKKVNFTQFTGVPCSLLKPFINYVIDSKKCDYIPATIEGEALSLAAGSYLAGKYSVVMMQNAGLGNIVNPVTSLLQIYKIPCLLIVTWRGEPGIKDAHQHKMMGEITLPLLSVLGIPHEILEPTEASLIQILDKALFTIKNEKKPFAIVLKKGVVEPYSLKIKEPFIRDSKFDRISIGKPRDALPTREEVTNIISLSTKDCPVISSTGFTSREFFSAGDRDSNFYMQGSMGFALSISLGLSRYYNKKVFCLDGDGSLLMHPGALFTAGMFHNGNLVYMLLDNNCHDSTGGQATISSNVKFDKLAESAGFDTYYEINDLKLLPELFQNLKTSNKLSFLYFKIATIKGEEKERPSPFPHEITERFKTFIEKTR